MVLGSRSKLQSSSVRMKSGGGENRRSNDALSSSSPSGGSASSSSHGGGGGEEEQEQEQQLQLPQQLQQYATFVDRTLKPELQVVEQAAQEVQNEIDDYKQLVEKIQRDLMTSTIKRTDTDTDAETTTMTTVVDLGYGKVRCRARPLQMHDQQGTKKIFVDVGLGFHVEFSTWEAIEFCKRRVEFLSTHKLKRHEQRMIEINDHILSATNILNELNNNMK